MEKRINADINIGAFYGYTQRNIDFEVSSDKETQKIQSFRLFATSSMDDWFIFDMLMFDTGTHSSSRTINNAIATADFSSSDARNQLTVGRIESYEGMTIILEAGLIIDSVKVDEYTDLTGNRFRSLFNVFYQVMAGVKVSGNYDNALADIKPFAGIYYYSTLLGADVQTSFLTR